MGVDPESLKGLPVEGPIRQGTGGSTRSLQEAVSCFLLVLSHNTEFPRMYLLARTVADSISLEFLFMEIREAWDHQRGFF